MKITILGVTILINEKKRFGLAEAKAALRFASEPSQVKAILGVVVGVLGFENAVAADVAEASTEVQKDTKATRRDIAESMGQIKALEFRIANQQDKVAELGKKEAHLGEIGSLFSLQPGK